jgi:Complex I intermediate-associated protein 30 (CIA30)
MPHPSEYRVMNHLNPTRRQTLLAASCLSPLVARLASAVEATPPGERLVLSAITADGDGLAPGARWRGFSDRVMGGISDGEFRRDVVDGRACLRMTGRVTRESNGGFIQMALDVGGRGRPFDASSFAGVEFLVHGNDEDYNVHVRTSDCSWYDESYRATFRAVPGWQRLTLAWTDFVANGLSAPLDPARIERVAVLGWMREFEADLAVAEVALVA